MIANAVGNMMRSLNPALLYDEKKDSLQLEQFRCFDFSSVKRELGLIFQADTVAKIQLQNVSLSYRVAVDGAGPYDEAPVREVDGVSAFVAERWDQLYAELGVDEMLLELEQAGTLQQSYIIGCWPDRQGRMRLHPFLPYQVASIAFGDPDAADNIADADEVVLCQVISRPNALGIISPWVTNIVLTRTECWRVYPDGTRVGLFADDGSNPLGEIPAVATRRVRPVFSSTNRSLSVDGGFLPNVAQDVKACNIGLIVALSHLMYVVRTQTHTKVAVFGEDAADLPNEIKDTPDGAMLFPADVKVTPIQLNPPVEKYIRVAETTIYYLSQFRYLRPEAYQASIVTGQARKQDALGFMAQSRRQERRCLKLEMELKRLIALVYNATQRTALKLDPDTVMRVRHRHVRTDENVLQEEQARAVKLQSLMAGYVEEVARMEGTTSAKARDILVGRMQELAEFGRSMAGGKTPGLNKLATEGSGTTDPTAPGDGPAALNATGEVQKQALNGAQVEALKAIVTDVATKALPPESAREMIRASFPIDDSVIDAMLGGLNGFESSATTSEPSTPIGMTPGKASPTGFDKVRR